MNLLKKLLVCFLAGLLLFSSQASAQLKISQMPTYVGPLDSVYIPIIVNNVNKKIHGTTLHDSLGTESDPVWNADKINYIRSDGSYLNPSWLASLAWSKITGAPLFLTSISGITAGGDLSGTYPNPSVNWANGYPTYDLRYASLSDNTGASSYNTIDLLNAPPASPATDDSYLIGTSPTGSWATHANQVAVWNGSSWDYTTAIPGDYVYTADDKVTYQLKSDNLWHQIPGIALLNNGNSINGPMSAGNTLNKTFSLITNNVARLHIAGNGDITFKKLTGSGAALLGLDATGLTSRINASNGYLKNSGGTWSFDNSTFQTQLNGTGFVKASGTTISYDNTTYVPATRTITINGTTLDLSADRSWTISGGTTSRYGYPGEDVLINENRDADGNGHTGNFHGWDTLTHSANVYLKDAANYLISQSIDSSLYQSGGKMWLYGATENHFGNSTIGWKTDASALYAVGLVFSSNATRKLLTIDTTTGKLNYGIATPLIGGTGLTSVASGDILIGSATNIWSALPKGTDGQILTLASGLPSWSNAGSGGVTTMAAVGSSPNNNGASISGSTLTLQPADASHPGVILSGTQNLGTGKSVTGNFIINNSSNEPYLALQRSGTARGYLGIASVTGASFFTNAIANDVLFRAEAGGRIIQGIDDGAGGAQASFIITRGVASGGSGTGITINNATLNATANNDVITGLKITNTFSNGAFSGVKNYGITLNSGLVGFGTTSPVNALHVYTSTSGDGIAIDGNAAHAFIMKMNGTTKGQWAIASTTGDFLSNSVSNDMIYRAANGGRILFGVDDGSGTAAAKAIIDANGLKYTGTTTNDDAATGNVGEYVESKVALGSAISLGTGTAANVTSVTLTAGDWDVSGIVNFNESGATVTARTAGINSTTATIPTDGTEGYLGFNTTTSTQKNSISLTRKRFSLSGTTTVYLVADITFSAGTCTGFGAITARRIR